jgi:nondiscriminating aspartyl-tRNA synthetase
MAIEGVREDRSSATVVHQRIWSDEIVAHLGQHVVLKGWVHHVRRLKHVGFLILRDARGTVQTVVDQQTLLMELDRLGHETVVAVTGRPERSSQAPGGAEVRLTKIQILSGSATPPFDLFRPDLEVSLPTMLDHAALSLRHPRRRAALQVSAASTHGFRSTLDALGFTEIHTPKLVSVATESGANVFPVDYFGKTAYLAQSPQFYKQIMTGVFERVYEVRPVFRAEPHDTPRHLNEYTSLDAEMAFIEDHRTVMSVLRDVIAGMVQGVESRAADALGRFETELAMVPATIPSLTFAEALELIETETGEHLAGVQDLAPAHERWLGNWAIRVHGSEFLFVTGFPRAKRPFYTYPDPASPGATNGFDLLFRGLELVTGGQRLHSLPEYEAALAEHDIDPDTLRGYMDAFRYGLPPHGGFAIGLERWVVQLLGLDNVRKATAFPRDMLRVTP